jgi:hypothetical protein
VGDAALTALPTIDTPGTFARGRLGLADSAHPEDPQRSPLAGLMGASAIT